MPSWNTWLSAPPDSCYREPQGQDCPGSNGQRQNVHRMRKVPFAVSAYAKSYHAPTQHTAVLALYLGALRQSEIIPMSANIRHPTRADFAIQENSAYLVIKWDKNMQKAGQKKVVTLPSIPDSPLCPVVSFLVNTGSGVSILAARTWRKWGRAEDELTRYWGRLCSGEG